MTQVRIRSVGREQFWCAGRKWTDKGRTVTIVENDELPRNMLRAKVNERKGRFVLDESKLKEGESPVIPMDKARPFWRGDSMFVRIDENYPGEDGNTKMRTKEYEVLTELDLPDKDGEFHRWSIGLRSEHDELDEITQADYAAICADYRFLAVESPKPPTLEVAPAKSASKPQPQQQARK